VPATVGKTIKYRYERVGKHLPLVLANRLKTIKMRLLICYMYRYHQKISAIWLVNQQSISRLSVQNIGKQINYIMVVAR